MPLPATPAPALTTAAGAGAPPPPGCGVGALAGCLALPSTPGCQGGPIRVLVYRACPFPSSWSPPAVCPHAGAQRLESGKRRGWCSRELRGAGDHMVTGEAQAAVKDGVAQGRVRLGAGGGVGGGGGAAPTTTRTLDMRGPALDDMGAGPAVPPFPRSERRAMSSTGSPGWAGAAGGRHGGATSM